MQQLDERPSTTGPSKITQMIQEEHDLLFAMLKEIRAVCANTANPNCANCTSELQQNCSNLAYNKLETLLHYMLEHFTEEERLMRGMAKTHEERNYHQAHLEHHANISATLAQCAQRLVRNQSTDAFIRISHLIEHWIDDHIARFDSKIAMFLGCHFL